MKYMNIFIFLLLLIANTNGKSSFKDLIEARSGEGIYTGRYFQSCFKPLCDLQIGYFVEQKNITEVFINRLNSSSHNCITIKNNV